MSSETEYQPRTIHSLVRWAAAAGIGFMLVRSLAYRLYPNFLPSSAWPRDSWTEAILISAAFELILLVVLIGVPLRIYFLRSRYKSVGDLLIDCAATGSLYLTALFLL